ncbi:phosphoribosylglycinamide formyltransferase [Peptoanaerobacter stomatis]|uniref:Phosphoribosylglycinamide formyltransferase n=1 Tax=Peptoanaerobacter stomatis TaxID=796937 RepID=V9HR94_9FIRM|nr:phosphoribosylglycinamide formyltransferase [Peptoanaerobacter stomatis]EHL18179.1 phosphoribosylglycinamide formyltransferase [Peptoanaerobacter stomatis]
MEKKKSNLFNIAVMVSGSGSNLQAIIDNVNLGYIKANIELVISSKQDVYALKRAKDNNIKSVVLKDDIKKMLGVLEENDIDLIVLAGYLSILDKKIIERYENRIINIHPSLIPKYCGKGYYGIKVHEQVIRNKEKVSGATVHYVDNGIDTGEIIIQEHLQVNEDDTAQTLQKRILEIEHKILPKAINIVIEKLKF